MSISGAPASPFTILPPPELPNIPLPPEVETVEATGLTMPFLGDLALKALYQGGQMTLGEIAGVLGLPVFNVADKIMEFLRLEHLVDIKGAGGFSSASYQFVILEKGAAHAQQALARSTYVGRAPVPLATYVEEVLQRSISNISVTEEDIAKAFAHLVIPRQTITQLGPAINSGKSIFLFGPPGNGKTTIAEVMAGLLSGEIVVPFAVEVDGQVIKVFDEVYHRPIVDVASQDRARFDHRWVISKRPILMTGGELTLETLDLIYDESTRFYEAPFQMKANGGIFMIDDFGRQRVSPRDLLNRWIVPLEKRVDYLTLHTGKKIEIPFGMLIVFSTNLDPADLVDEAFLRRIRYKIGIGSPTVEQYEEILKRLCARKEIAYHAEALSQILAYYRKKGIELRSCHPRDILEQIIDTARFLQRPPSLDPDLIEMACDSYFVSLNAEGVAAS